MRRVLRRETLIALRARREAHRIAAEVINQPLEVPEFVPQAPLPREAVLQGPIIIHYLPPAIKAPGPSKGEVMQDVVWAILGVMFLGALLIALLLLATR